jgi:diaminopimelate epimerase
MNQIGKIICDAQIFPNGINIGFCKKISNDSCILKVFERGVGLTLACGSGACASSFLGVQNQIFESNLINVYFLENEISDDLDKNNLIQVEINDLKTILMIGTSEYVFSGKIREDF